MLSSPREHLQTPEALKQGDGQAAEKLTHEHVDHAGRFLLDSFLTHSDNHGEPRLTVTI